MDQMVSVEQDLEVDIEAGLSDELKYPLMRDENPAVASSQSLVLSGEKCEDVKLKKSRKATKPPRPPKCPSLSVNDHKLMREMAELAMRKRARIERMKKSLNRIKAAKSSSSSPCISIFSMIVTVLFFFFLVFQGLFAGNSSLSSDKSLAPTISPNNQLISVQFHNEFVAPVEQTDHSPTTSLKYTRKRISGASEEDSRDVTR